MIKIMKRKTIMVSATLLMLISLTACQTKNTSADINNNSSVQTEMTQSAENNEQTSPTPKEESSASNTKSTETADSGKILIAYFAVAENSDVDAVSSASVTEVNGEAKGLVRTVAEDIQAVTGGDLFSIETSVDYPGDINDLIDYASEEQSNDDRPELTSHIENLDQYDTIFIGYPLWWYNLPQVMYSFFDEYDFSGKTIIPFDVHRGSGLSSTPETIQELEPNATVVTDGFAVSHETAASSVASVADDVKEWLDGLDY